MKKQIILGVLALLAAAWLALVISQRAVLVWGGIDTDREIVKVLECHYFTGTRIVTKEYLHGKVLGREHCPRWLAPPKQ